jgi:putative spermidine/putrescine transport system ATP-binding protein
MLGVELQKLTKSYGETNVVDHIDLNIEEGKFFSILGPSGCGKTTTLRMLAGFAQPTSGKILLDGKDITYLPSNKRNMGMVFQNYAIFPHMSIFDNIAFGLKMRKVPKEEIHQRVTESLKQVGLEGYGKRFSKQLSGGEQQRVALARVLVIKPQVLLLDEPLSALDKLKREEMQFWIKDLQRSVGITTIYVTHDQIEAMTVSDKIMLMNKGTICQIGTPRDLYDNPSSKFVANFIGESNIFDGTIQDIDNSTVVIECKEGIRVITSKKDGLTKGREVSIVIRPEKIRIQKIDQQIHDDEKNIIKGGIIKEQVYRGANIRYSVLLQTHKEVIVDSPKTSEENTFTIGEKVNLLWENKHVSILIN